MRLLDPTLDAESEDVAAAPRLPALAGRTVALLSNGKAGTAEFFDFLAERLLAEHGAARVLRDHKPEMSRSAPSEVVARLTAADAVIAGIGD